jgi:hypothetical protein
MTSLTADPDNALGAVALTVTQTAAVTSITRSDRNGVAQVRAAARQLPTAATGTTIITDYEAAHGANTYTVYHADGSVAATGTAQLALARPMLLVPIAPNYSEAVDTITDYDAGRSSFSTVHNIIGRADPIVVMGKLGTRQGSLEIFTTSLEDAARVTRVFDRGEAVMLKQTLAGMDMYFTAESINVTPYQVDGEATTRFKLTVAYVEVIRPYGNLAGALGWTFNALASAYPTFDAQLAAYSTFDNLTLGDKS